MGIHCQVLINSLGTIRRYQSVQKHTTIYFDACGALANFTRITEHSELEETHRNHGVQPLSEWPIRGSNAQPVPGTPGKSPALTRPGHAEAALSLQRGPGQAPRSARAGTQPGNAASASPPRAAGGEIGRAHV